ncbi:hypothetical protein ACLX1H_003170 [Fusarium chlamydosporum]
MNSSMSPTRLIIFVVVILYTTAVLARFTDYPLPTAGITVDAADSIPTLTSRAFRLEVRSAESVPVYTITYAPDSVCGYLSGSVEIPITCENKNRCLWELEKFKWIVCELDGETTGIARTRCLAKDEVNDTKICEDNCLSNTYNLLCTNDTAPYCRTYAYPEGASDYRCASTNGSRVSSVDFTYNGQKFPTVDISVFTDGDVSRESASSSETSTTSGVTTTRSEELDSTTSEDPEPDNGNGGSGNKTGTIVGGVVGGVGGAVLIIACAWLYFKCYRPRQSERPNELRI